MIKEKAITGISLIGYQDSSFIEWCRRMKKSAADNRPHDTYMADYSRMLASLEECARQFLGQHVCLSAERVLRYRCVSNNGYERQKFRELDAVYFASGHPICVIEIKFREKGLTARKGYGQLNRSLSILRQRWHTINGIFLSFWMAPVFGFDDMPPEALEEIADVLKFAAQPAASASANFCVNGQRFLEDATDLGHWTAAQTSELLKLRKAAIDPLSTLNTNSDRKGLNSLDNLFDNLSGGSARGTTSCKRAGSLGSVRSRPTLPPARNLLH